MDASVKRSTKYLWLAVIIGCAVLVSTGVACLKFGRHEPRRFLLQECFKTSLTFTFIAVGGALVKAVLDAEGDRRSELKAESDARKEQRRSLVRELTEVFSGFYTVRKQYHSALGARIDKNALLREAVELEGRYGGLKVQALIHLDLPLGDFQYKRLPELEERIKNEKDPTNSRGFGSSFWAKHSTDGDTVWRKEVKSKPPVRRGVDTNMYWYY
jgi:hypothetical protein